MQRHEDEEIRSALDLAFPPVDEQLRRDLWPLMMQRMERPRRVVPWYDWALAGVVVGACVFFPRLALLLVYHL